MRRARLGGWLKDPGKNGGGVFDLLIHDVDFACLFGCAGRLRHGRHRRRVIPT